jgi:hypothetical protein
VHEPCWIDNRQIPILVIAVLGAVQWAQAAQEIDGAVRIEAGMKAIRTMGMMYDDTSLYEVYADASLPHLIPYITAPDANVRLEIVPVECGETAAEAREIAVIAAGRGGGYRTCGCPGHSCL